MKTFTVKFPPSEGDEHGHTDKGRILEDGTAEVWCPWDGRWIPFQSVEAALSMPGYSEDNAVFAWDEQDA